MTNTKIFAEEMLLDEELEKVSGGTREEFIDLVKILPKVVVPRYGNKNARPEIMSKGQVEIWLKANLNIDAELSLGNRIFDRPGVANTYSIDGESLTHEEVMTELKTFFNK